MSAHPVDVIEQHFARIASREFIRQFLWKSRKLPQQETMSGQERRQAQFLILQREQVGAQLICLPSKSRRPNSTSSSVNSPLASMTERTTVFVVRHRARTLTRPSFSKPI